MNAFLNSDLFVLVLVMAVVAPVAIIAVRLFTPKKKVRVTSDIRYLKVNNKHRKYSNNFITRKSYRNIYDTLSRLSIYGSQEVRVLAVHYFEMSSACLLLVWGVGTYIFKDFVLSIILALFALLIKNKYIDGNIDKTKRRLLYEYSTALSSLRDAYKRLDNIPDALSECTKGPTVRQQIDEIYAICTAVDGEELLEEFFNKCQFRQLRTLANVCYVLNDTGDTVDEHGQSTFWTDVGLIKDEVDLEVRKNTSIRLKFRALEYLPIIPIFGIRLIEVFFSSAVPGTLPIYNGIVGYVSKTIIALLALIGYYILTTINSEQYVRTNDRLEFVNNMLKKRWYKEIVTNITPKNPKKLALLGNKIRGCLSSKDVQYIYGEKIIISVAVFVVAILATILMTYTARTFIYNNIRPMQVSGGYTYSKEVSKALLDYDHSVLAMDALPADNEIATQLVPVLKRASEFQRLDEVTRIKAKYESYHKTYYKWYYVLIAYIFGIVGWFLPDIMLKFRAYMVRSEAEEDVLQMQTVIAAVMGTTLDTMSVLYWMEKNSTVHKDALLFCYHEYTQDAEKALTRLKSTSAVAEFDHMCDKLITTIHQITVKEAFADLLSERSHVMKVREMMQENSIENKRAIASPIALASMYALMLLHVMLPIGILGVSEFMKVFQETLI